MPLLLYYFYTTLLPERCHYYFSTTPPHSSAFRGMAPRLGLREARAILAEVRRRASVVAAELMAEREAQEATEAAALGVI